MYFQHSYTSGEFKYIYSRILFNRIAYTRFHTLVSRADRPYRYFHLKMETQAMSKTYLLVFRIKTIEKNS
jgi:hypothetical protein